ncbi:MAG: UDP-N-acetylmuramyl-tripeptide synthetase, partial [Vicinamibacterales bacterium]
MTADPRYRRKLDEMRLALRDTLTIGVTGTKGKTSTAEFIAQVMESCGLLTAVSTSEASRIGTRSQEVGDSTWDLIDFALRARRAGVACFVVELPSIALAWGINHGFDFDLCVLTNIGTDHIPTHGNRRNYLSAKQRMFRDLSRLPHTPLPIAVLNADDPESDAFASCLRPEVTLVTYGLTGRRLRGRRAERHLDAVDVAHDARGTSFTVLGLPDGPVPCRTTLHGGFNVLNVLAALASTVARPAATARLARAVRDLRPPAGRFDVVAWPSSTRPGVVVDYAHTPESLESALTAARSLAGQQHLHAVFGCGGGIYQRKRPMMGAAAARLADLVTITTDNPRFEPPDVIARHVLRGIAISQRTRVRLEPNRAHAITAAIIQASGGDVVAVLGRGADRLQAIGGHHRPLSDRRVALAALDRRLPHASSTGGVSLSAIGAVVLDPHGDVALFDKRADCVRPTASLVKLMTLLLAFDAIADGQLSLRDT